MQVSFEKVDDVVSAVRTCAKAVSKNAGAEQDLLLTARGGELTITALETPNHQLQLTIPGHILTVGSCLVTTKDLQDRLSGLDPKHKLDLELDLGRLCATASKDMTMRNKNHIDISLSAFDVGQLAPHTIPNLELCAFEDGENFVEWLERLVEAVPDATTFLLRLSGTTLFGYIRDDNESTNVLQTLEVSEHYCDFEIILHPDSIKYLPSPGPGERLVLTQSVDNNQIGFVWSRGNYWCIVSAESLDTSRIAMGLELPASAAITVNREEYQRALRQHKIGSNTCGTQFELSGGDLILSEVGFASLRCKASVGCSWIHPDGDWAVCNDEPAKHYKFANGYFSSPDITIEQFRSPVDPDCICLRLYNPADVGYGSLWTTTLTF
jgi:hypothetical protein